MTRGTGHSRELQSSRQHSIPLIGAARSESYCPLPSNRYCSHCTLVGRRQRTAASREAPCSNASLSHLAHAGGQQLAFPLLSSVLYASLVASHRGQHFAPPSNHPQSPAQRRTQQTTSSTNGLYPLIAGLASPSTLLCILQFTVCRADIRFFGCEQALESSRPYLAYLRTDVQRPRGSHHPKSLPDSRA
jgi:hypothetical protein